MAAIDVPGKTTSDGRLRQLVDASSRVVLGDTHVEPTSDMAAERSRATINSEALAVFMNGGAAKLHRKRELAEFLATKPWADKKRRYFLTRPEEYRDGLKAALGIWDAMQEGDLSMADGMIMRSLVNFPGGLELHIGMWIPALLGQASEEQQQRWLPPSQRLEVIGTYAQTELGHGTFVRGLETTATYDPNTQQFVIHSPTLSSTKWWPGGLGKTATHVVCMARLFIKGKDYGPHGFIVQIRSLATHQPLPGVTVGDIGPKFGYNGVDNGFLRFNYVCIPRDNMLMRFAKVTPEGRYVPPPPANSKASFSTMVYVRATIVEEAGEYLARAVTIATRYTAVRRQTAPAPGARETQVLDYQNVAADLLPTVAAAYALKFMGQGAMADYRKFEEGRDQGDFSLLPELHASLSCLKALCTWITCEGIERCRFQCGGHGYSLLSGLPTIYASYVQNATWEGDNNVLCLQTARYLLKALAAAAKGQKLGGGAAYLADASAEAKRRCGVASAQGWLDPQAQLAALRHRASRLTAEAAQTLAAASGGGKPAYEGAAWNGCTADMVGAARAHAYLVLQANYFDRVRGVQQQGEVPEGTAGVLLQLAQLFGVNTIHRQLGDFLEDGYMSEQQAKWARQAVYETVRAVRPNAVALVDGFGFTDYLLNSALGRSDGDVYKALLEMAQSSPLNDSQEGPGWEGVLQPRLAPHAKL